MRQLRGGCHCGNVTYTLHWPPDAELVLRKCGCTFCTKQGAVYTAHRGAKLEVTVRGPDAVRRYQFETETAECNFCSRCGVYLFATSTIGGRQYATVNAMSLDGFVAPAEVKVKNFEGETTQNRLGRRSDTWIADVRMTVSGR